VRADRVNGIRPLISRQLVGPKSGGRMADSLGCALISVGSEIGGCIRLVPSETKEIVPATARSLRVCDRRVNADCQFGQV